jgi:hypothetical protein
VRRHSRALIALVGVAFVAAVGANGSAQAQSTASSDLGSQFGGFHIDSAGEGMTFTYNSPGLIPGTPAPLFAASLPETLTNMDSGPSGFALASLAYPGPLVADLPTVLALGGVPNANQIPAYPVRSQAFYPAGPTTASQDLGSGRESAATDAASAQARAVYGAAQLPPALAVGSVTSASESHLEQKAVVSRTRVELTGVDIALGVIHMDSIVTDLVATSDGSAASTAGTTVVTGMKVLGQPATIDGTGVHLSNPAPEPASSPIPTLPLGGVTAPLQQALDPLNQLLLTTLGTANADVNQLLAQGGITVRLIEPNEVAKGPEASRLASGVLVTIVYNGSTEPVLSNILSLIPVESLPSQGVGPIPFSSPQSIVLALKATHVETVGLAAGHVHVVAAPPFALPSLPSTRALGSSSGSGFSTPTPSLAGGGGGGAGASGGSGTLGSTSPLGFVGGSPLAAAVSIMLLLLTGSAFWFGSGRLADNVLSVASSSCPEGLDRG